MDAEIVRKIEQYCAYQERSHHEVRYKLVALGSRGEDLEMIMMHLIEENFLNEERFVMAFVSGKFKIKKWGKIKIAQGLKAKNISPFLIQKGLQSISPNDYFNTLESLALKKWQALAQLSFPIKKKKTSDYLLQKGYEYNLIQEVWQSDIFEA